MTKAITALIAVALLYTASIATAAPCTTQGSKDAKQLTFDLKDKETLRGFHYAFRFGLEPAEFPADDIAKIAMPCARGTVALPSRVLELRGENTDTPPRWASAADLRNIVVFVASMPRPDAARRWADARQKGDSGNSIMFKPEEMMVAVVLTSGTDIRHVFAFFDKIPDDDRLKAMIPDIALGKAHWLVGFDVETRGVTPNTGP